MTCSVHNSSILYRRPLQLHVNQSRPFLHQIQLSSVSTDDDKNDNGDVTASDVITNRARSNVVMEIVLAEREYVKHLRDVVEVSVLLL